MNDFNTPANDSNNGKQTNPSYQAVGKDSALPLPPHQFQVPLNSLFTSVFGIAGQYIRKYKVPEEEKKNAEAAYTINMDDERVPSEVNSYLGTPVHFWMKLLGGKYRLRVQGSLALSQIEDCVLPFSSVATFGRSKRYTETPMVGQKGTVIEEYGFDAWDIKIQGFIINNTQEGTVEDQVRRLKRWENFSDGIQVSGTFFSFLGIDEIAVTKIDFLPSRNINMESVIPFEITARSNEDIDLVIIG